MERLRYLYDLDDRPPFRHALLYGLQWACIMFPNLVIAAAMCGGALGLGAGEQTGFLGLTLLLSGAFTVIQPLFGHRYPVLEGPSTALLLTFVVLAPLGIGAIQGGLVVGGAMVAVAALSGVLSKLPRWVTPNVVGAILMLIAFSLAPHLASLMAGRGAAHPAGEAASFFASIGLTLFTAWLAYRLKGVRQTLAVLVGMTAGTALFAALGRIPWERVAEAGWLSLPGGWAPGLPEWSTPAVLSFAAAYVAVVVNALGSLQGIAGVTDAARLPVAIRRGVFLNGVAGVVCGMTGLVGMVSYSLSPGVVAVNRVASRHVVAVCGVILCAAAFLPKLSALLAAVPAPVVGAALCTALGSQVGIGLSVVSEGGLTSRDALVVGIPVLTGTLVGFLPQGFFEPLPQTLRVLVQNGLVVGIVLALLLEHGLARPQKEPLP